jgi:cytochrome P450
VRRIDNVVYRMIRDRRQGGQADDLLSSLLKACDEPGDAGLTDRELRDETITMLLAGHETTAHALAWTFSLLARSRHVAASLREANTSLGETRPRDRPPSAEERLASEARAVLGNRLPEREDLDRLQYTDWAFAEAIRLYPSIWIMERRVVTDDEIGGYAIPAGSTLLISPYVLHRHPRFWPSAECFDPERFSPAQVVERPRHAYIPFGAGPHQCIGRFMAPLVAKLVLAMVARQFTLLPVSAEVSPPLPGITLRHASGLWMIPVERS